MPKTMKPAEIIAKGKEAGIAITSANVHATRYMDSANGHKKKNKAARATTKKGRKPKAVTAATRKRLLAKFPSKATAETVFDQVDSKELAERVVTSLRQLMRLSVRDEIKAVMGGLFNGPIGNLLSK